MKDLFNRLNEKACSLADEFIDGIRKAMKDHGLKALRLNDDTACIIVYEYDSNGYIGVREDRVMGFYLDDDDLLVRTEPYSPRVLVTNDVVTGPDLPDSDILEECIYADSDFVNLLSFLDISGTVQEACDNLDLEKRG